VRSFFEIHYMPLRMRRGDYPKGESIGVRRANKKAILKAVENPRNRNKKQLKALILFLKDSGLRISDLQRLNYGDIQVPLERGDKVIPITLITQKSKIVAKTFIGKEAIDALQEYLNERRKGNRRLAPEQITAKSPLFRTQEGKEVKRISRSGISSIIHFAFLRVSEANISAHSLRKFLQTNLEVSGVNVNWIDKILGHRLINSRDAYSKPTDEQLKEAYTQAYSQIRIYPEGIIENTKTTPEPTKDEYIVKTASNLSEAIQLTAQGYEYAAEIDGTKLFKKRK
jgi:site-specific recombinase XerD